MKEILDKRLIDSFECEWISHAAAPEMILDDRKRVCLRRGCLHDNYLQLWFVSLMTSAVAAPEIKSFEQKLIPSSSTTPHNPLCLTN